MTAAIGPRIAELSRALAAASQTGHRDSGAAAAAPSAGTSRSGHEGDSVTLSEAALQFVTIRRPDGTEAEGRLLTGLKPITPQSQRSEAEAGIRRMMADLGIEGDLEFSIAWRDDGSIAVTSSDSRAAEIEAAINDDPALQKTLRGLQMLSRFAYEGPAMREAIEAIGAAGDKPVKPDPFEAMNALRERLASSSYTMTMSGGVLTTAFVDPSGERFGGIVPQEAAA